MNNVKHITTTINRTPADVYAYASNPENLPLWAAGLARSEITKQGDAWVAQAPFGKVKIKFAPANSFGVLDHDVQLESGVVVHNPMRVVPNGKGSEFTFTLFQQAGMSQQQFEEDAQAVEHDLHTLKTILESAS
ncbi:SRPBCC family protein [Limnobacter parvus]|uniref:SRPBCC family protein n=1 Tax=Limnobacter parvus TaxID=2939690 RepID=A0ABT1XJU3_9BURK|nr:SRPBCC family protein [Limnobacter parvus]MCR2747434.1 SRPBCC family protein [Limnobacter parvus]